MSSQYSPVVYSVILFKGKLPCLGCADDSMVNADIVAVKGGKVISGILKMYSPEALAQAKKRSEKARCVVILNVK